MPMPTPNMGLGGEERWHFNNGESPQQGPMDDFNFNANMGMPVNNMPGNFTWEMIGLGLEEPLPPQETIDELHQIYFEKVHPSMPMIHRYRYLAAMNLYVLSLQKEISLPLHQLSETDLSGSYSQTMMGEDLRQKLGEWKWLTILQGAKSAATSLFTIRHVDIVVLHLGKVHRPEGSVLPESTQVRRGRLHERVWRAHDFYCSLPDTHPAVEL